MSNKKNIWFINQYASTPNVGMGGRHYYLARELAKLGHTVYVIVGSYSHLLRNPIVLEQDFFIENIAVNFNFVWVKLPMYASAHSKQRIINEFLFSFKIKKMIKVIHNKPDIIYHSSPALISYFGAKYLSNYFNVPYVFEERDIWPLTLIELGDYSKNHPFIILLQWIQDSAYKKSIFVFSNLPNAGQHLLERGGDINKFHWIPNGISLDEMKNKQQLSKGIRTQIPRGKFVIGYTGTIGLSNGLDSLINAAILVKEQINIHFVLVGEGREKDRLIKKCKEYQLSNISFIPSVPKLQVQSMLELFDVCFVGSKYSSLYRYGASPNKVPEYLYAGKPIIYSISDNENLVQQAQAGVIVQPENVSELSNVILYLYGLDKSKRDEMGLRGHYFAIHYLSYEIIAKRLEKVILNLR